MTRTDGKPKVDGVEVGELTFITIGPPTPVLTVKLAFVNSETGDRLGFSNRNTGWSEKTMTALDALVKAVEEDACRTLFNEGTTTDGGSVLHPVPIDGVESL